MSRPTSADQAYHVEHEWEPDGKGGYAHATTIFLTASECPIGCSMCDLWQNTLTVPTPPGAIVRQIKTVLDEPLDHDRQWIKLYNSGNFFDPRSIPPADYAAIAKLCEPFQRVVVENHPHIGGDRMLRFNDMLDAQLEIAVGLETVQPRWLDRLGKRMTRDSFDQFAQGLIDHHIDLRVFLIVGVPGISTNESARWTRSSVRHAVLAGARHISLIPARQGHGWNGQADQLPQCSDQELRDLLNAAIHDANGYATVTLDTWGRDPT
ncbi:Fe-S oxidoreductase [Rubripirellula amarantea]|uniref:Fe-S oxidoreductase n=1 Tax=Rubripirellula amarantea TaxID=2527999 RepID=UPI0011B77139|nr:Fe-S oxidoreductase [Rubripirellula amarantea]